MATRVVEIRVADVAARFALLDDLAPRTAAAFWESMPITGTATHARWAGPAVWIKTPAPALNEIQELELPVTSIYPGTVVCRATPNGYTEVFVSYGSAESRSPTGRSYATPVAELLEANPAFFAALAATWREGSKPITFDRVEG